MKAIRLLPVSVLLLLIFSPSMALEGATVELGKKLFGSTQFGDKGRSCKSCHVEGEGLTLVGDFSDEELKDIINACIRDAMGGELIDIESQKMNSLLLYVRTFQKN